MYESACSLVIGFFQAFKVALVDTYFVCIYFNNLYLELYKSKFMTNWKIIRKFKILSFFRYD